MALPGISAPVLVPKAEVEKILKYCRPEVTAEEWNKIDEEAKAEKWDPCNTLINDAIHGPVELNSLLTAILDTPEFQRLRFIKQLGGGCYVYPGANHTRFDHSIGVAYIAGEFGNHLKKQFEAEIKYKKLSEKDPRAVSEEEVLCLQIAGLCHDLGHGPFSHTFEHRVLNRMTGVNISHEQISLKVFEKIMTHHSVLIQFAYVYKLGFNEFLLIKDMIHPNRDRKLDEPSPLSTRSQKQFLLEIVANKTSGIDVDKWDYFTRDCHYLGIAMDFQWKRCMLLSRVCKVAGDPDDSDYHIAFRNKEVDNLYGMGRTRSTLHRKAYVHKTKVAVEEMFARAIIEVKDVPLIPVTVDSEGDRKPNYSIKEAIGLLVDLAKKDDLQWFIALNDVSVTTLIIHWNSKLIEKPDEQCMRSISKAKDLLERINNRQLFHLVDVEETVRFPKYSQDLQVKPTKSETGSAEGIESWNITNMMTPFKKDRQKESRRKKRLLELNVEVFGQNTSEADNTFIEIVSISFGSERKTDPMEGVLFYGKDNPEVAEKWPRSVGTKRTSSSLALPKHFTEYEIRLYYTGKEKKTMPLSNKFEIWLAKMKEFDNDKYQERKLSGN